MESSNIENMTGGTSARLILGFSVKMAQKFGAERYRLQKRLSEIPAEGEARTLKDGREGGF